ncbi:MAG: peptidase domain-containing ABC transporter [Nitrosomonadales bacterium]
MMADKFSHTVVQCLTAIAQHHGLQVNPERLIHEYALADEEPALPLILRMATEMGLKARDEKISWNGLFAMGGVFPILARRTNGTAVIVVGARPAAGGGDGSIAILDPLADMTAVAWIDRGQFCSLWDGEVVFLKRSHSITDLNQPFSLRWFIPEILKQRKAFRDIIIAAIAMNMLALASPMFFQIVIDKVLVHQSVSTLGVLAVGVVIALVFDSIFGYLRQFLLMVATNKIDMRITRRAFGHLLSLSIDYFETTSAGVITRHMQQLEGIRNFLTGRLFFTALDTISLLVFFPILFSYSFKLTLIVLVFTLVIASIIVAVLPAYKRRLDILYSAEGKRQSLMVETIHGMRTVKALAIEPMQRRSWDQFSAEAITAHFSVGQLALNSNFVTDLLGKLLPIAIIVIGCQGVFDQTMSVGALIAFQMLSGRVVGPLLSLVSLVNEYQQTALSVRMLGSVMNRPPEGKGGGGLRPQLEGSITFDDVTFRYPGASTTALDRATFTIPAGAIVGIVGRSGSGKTTLTKLIQGLYPVQEGVVRFDGLDAREIDLSHLRRQIGVVLQENFFISRFGSRKH